MVCFLLFMYDSDERMDALSSMINQPSCFWETLPCASFCICRLNIDQICGEQHQKTFVFRAVAPFFQAARKQFICLYFSLHCKNISNQKLMTANCLRQAPAPHEPRTLQHLTEPLHGLSFFVLDMRVYDTFGRFGNRYLAEDSLSSAKFLSHMKDNWYFICDTLLTSVHNLMLDWQR